jgi:hypothetical protein
LKFKHGIQSGFQKNISIFFERRVDHEEKQTNRKDDMDIDEESLGMIF